VYKIQRVVIQRVGCRQRSILYRRLPTEGLSRRGGRLTALLDSHFRLRLAMVRTAILRRCWTQVSRRRADAVNFVGRAL
jgi:hypothetical protein